MNFKSGDRQTHTHTNKVNLIDCWTATFAVKKFHSMQMKECDDSTNVSWNNSETDLEEFNRKISSIWLQLYGINRDLDRLWNVHSITFLVIQSEMSFFQLFLLYHVSVYFSLGSQSQSTGMTFYVLTLWKRLSLIF